MNAAQIHLAFNHFPVVATVVALPLFFWGVLKGKGEYLRSASFAWVIGAVGAMIAMNTGEGAEELIEHLPGVAESFIEHHEDAAKAAMFAMLPLLAGGFYTLWATRAGQALKRPVAWVLLALNLAAAGAMGYAAHLGGLVRHTELRDAAAPSDN